MKETTKGPIIDGEVYDAELDTLGQQDGEVMEVKGTAADRQAMWRMGKVQEMRRNFRFVSIFGFSMILMASWETMLG
jgi:choline transport protein